MRTSFFYCSLVLALFACSGPEEPAPARPAVGENRLEVAARDTDGLTRVLVLHDLEGLSGQQDPDTFRFSKPESYAAGREYLVGDVNAVIAVLFDGGADEVHVVDGHGSGNPEPDLLLDQLDSRASMIFRDEPFRQYLDLVEPGTYDAVAVVGMHAKTGSGGFASHTYTLGIEMRLNDHAITETELVGFSFGRAGTPVIFASGDDRLAKDLETMPWIEFVTVKKATSASTAEPRPVDEAWGALHDGAQRALQNRDQAKVMKIGTPIKAALRVVPPASLSVLKSVPGIDYENETVTFMAADFEEAYEGLTELIGVARTNYSTLMIEILRTHPEGKTILSSYSDKLFERWLDFKSGRWTPPEPPPTVEGQRYRGAR